MIDLDFQGLKFKGTVLITMKTERDVILDAAGLAIKRAHCNGTEFRFIQKGEELTVETGQFDGILGVEYQGAIPDSLAGIYRAPYDNTHIITTHFEAAQARRMFPCIDRPDVKAVFKLSVKVNEGLEAISNMPIESVRRENNGKRVVTFQPTPRMSTYLLYLGVGKFQSRTVSAGRTEIIVATTPGKVEKCVFAESEARKALEFFNAYYKIPYALPKVHLIAVPEFPMGAMENWGAITFREILLLVDENSSSRNKMRAAMAIAHELAHQWFGDLVTMKWWDDIWLNESFATYMAYKAIDHAHPEWMIWENFCNGEPRVESQAGAMERDSLKNTHPIQVPVNAPAEIEEVFDEISYGKGAHVLQMVDAYVGEDAFREGVHRYLTKHAYGNATGDDLWSTIEEASGKPVKRIMSAWVQQSGFPLIKVSKDDGKLLLKQESFTISDHPTKLSWPVPFVAEVNGERRSILMDTPVAELQVGEVKSLSVNPGRTSFFAVDNHGLGNLVWANASKYDRWGMLFDAFLFLKAGRTTFNDYLSLLRRFENEQNALPAQEISDQLTLLHSLAPRVIGPVAKSIHHTLLETFIGKSDEKGSILRGILAARLAVLDSEYAANLSKEFKEYEGVAPEMRLAVATAYARSTKDLDGLIQVYGKSTSDEDKTKFLSSMTVFDDEKLVERALEFALGGNVKRQDILRVVRAKEGMGEPGAADNPQARNLMWDWLRNHIGKLQELYEHTGLLSQFFASTIPVIGVGRVREVQDFFSEHVIPDAASGIKVGLEKLQVYDRLANDMMRHG
jgi:tricorn protease interacting factor F2/3